MSTPLYVCPGRKPEQAQYPRGGFDPKPHEFTTAPTGQVICRYCGRGPLK